MSHNRHTRSAFTLIELLVVIAIIALLAAILFPVFGRARENARRSSCASNLKQMALGLKQYTQDYDEKFPFAASIGAVADPAGYATAWAPAIQPYIKSLQIFQCPSDDDKSVPTSNPGSVGYTDYWYNAALSMSWAGGTASPNYRTSGVNEAALLNSSLTIMVGEGDGNNLSYGAYRVNGCALAGNANINNPEVDSSKCDVTTYFAKAIGVGKGQRNHLNGFNLAFTDGHVKWQRMVDTDVNQNSASATIYNVRAGFKTSGNSPTFNAVSDDNR